jgi:CheY-like chemotaxis protein
MLNKIVLIDDNAATNFLHKKILDKENCSKEVVTFQMGQRALDYLSEKENTVPELLFVDINMPTMDVWEFLEYFEDLSREDKTAIKIILLTTSLSPQDEEKISKLSNVEQIMIKPLSAASLKHIFETFF